MLGPGALSILFSNRLPQGKASGAVDALSRSSPEKPGRSSSQRHSSLSPGVTNGPSAPRFVCKRHVLSPLLQFWRCAPEEDVLIQDQFDGKEDVEGVVHHQGLSYVLEIIRTELTTKKTRTRCHEILAVAATDTYLLLKRLGRDCLCHWKARSYN